MISQSLKSQSFVQHKSNRSEGLYSYNSKRSTNDRSRYSFKQIPQSPSVPIHHGNIRFGSDTKSNIKKKLMESDGYAIVPDRWSPSGWKFAYVDPLKTKYF